MTLITTGAAGTPLLGADGNSVQSPAAAIDGSGQDIYFESNAALSPADGDEQTDIYDARVNGGFSFTETTCSGDACQPPVSLAPAPRPSASETPGPGNPPQPKGCSKGKVSRHGKCVKKSTKKHGAKNHHGKKSSHKRGGGK